MDPELPQQYAGFSEQGSLRPYPPEPGFAEPPAEPVRLYEQKQHPRLNTTESVPEMPYKPPNP